MHCLMHWLDALLDSRSTRFPFTSTPSPPAPLAIRKAPSASVESIQPRPPQPCEVGRPKGRRRKSRRQSHNFFSTDAAGGTPTRRHALGRLPTPPPLPENLLLGLHRKLPSEPPASTQEVSESEVPVHVPLRRPRPLRFARLPVLVWNPYSRGRLGPAKSEDPKGGEGKTDANLTHFLSTDAAGGTPPRRHALGRLTTPPPLPENLLLGLHRKLPSVPPASTQEVSESENRPATRGTAHSEVQGMLDALLDALLDPLPPFTFCCPQAIVDEEAGV